jgi:FkbM family methyltransferase
MRRPLKSEALSKLKAMNVPVGSVIDVGILSGTAELAIAYRDKFQLLIEPIVEWNPTIVKSYADRGVAHEIVNVAASNFDGEMNMETSSVISGVPISHARLTDKGPGMNIRRVPVRRVDTLLAERTLAKPYLLKIDVDGVELLILEGAKSTLPDCSVIIIEAHPRDIRERLLAVSDAGFELFDIVDPCYYDGRLAQVDLVFINRQTVRKHGLDMYRTGFDYKKWESYR